MSREHVMAGWQSMKWTGLDPVDFGSKLPKPIHDGFVVGDVVALKPRGDKKMPLVLKDYDASTVFIVRGVLSGNATQVLTLSPMVLDKTKVKIESVPGFLFERV